MPRPAPDCTGHFVACRDQFSHRGRHQADAIFVHLDFSGNADTHEYGPPNAARWPAPDLQILAAPAWQRFAKSLNIAHVFWQNIAYQPVKVTDYAT